MSKSVQNIIVDYLRPSKASYMPGEAASIKASIFNHTGKTLILKADWHLRYLDEIVRHRCQTIELPEAAAHLVNFSLSLPPESFRGYGFDLALHDEDDNLLGEYSTALDVLDNWTQAPRYGFLSDFVPGDDDEHAVAIARSLAGYHINVVQFYDWMWRHYELMPPEDTFIDGCGRQLSLDAVRRKVAACRKFGMAVLGYAAVYGAEGEYALVHPDEMLYDASGEPYSLEKLFYIMNIHVGNPWRERILKTMVEAVHTVPLDGLHLDQYGFPKEHIFGPAPTNVPYDLAEDFPPFIDDARAAIRSVSPQSRVIFNAVTNWPIEAVAPTHQDATYIEVWSPYDSYHDLQELILNARRLAPDKQVILAAYLKPLKDASSEELPQAEAATRLASAAIWASGGFHLLLGEQNGTLCDPYYPSYAQMRPAFAQVMQSYYDFVVRYENLLSDPRLITINEPELTIENVPVSSTGEAGKLWAIQRTLPGWSILSLVNLKGAADALWNAPKPPAISLYDLEVELVVKGQVASIFTATPDSNQGRPSRLEPHLFQQSDTTRIQFCLPALEYWSVIAIKI